MGRDKAVLPFEGTPMVVRVADTLRSAGCDPVVAIGGDEKALVALGLDSVPDRWPGEGPVGGVITALDNFPSHDAVAVVACDLPHLSALTLTQLFTALGDDDDFDVAIAVTDQRHSACTAWRSAARQELTDAFSGGARKLLDALAGLRVVEVVANDRELTNVNTPDDLSK